MSMSEGSDGDVRVRGSVDDGGSVNHGGVDDGGGVVSHRFVDYSVETAKNTFGK